MDANPERTQADAARWLDIINRFLALSSAEREAIIRDLERLNTTISKADRKQEQRDAR